METLSCPKCGAEMVRRARGLTFANQCPDGHGVFLERADLGSLIEAETDWHSRTVHDTATLPRITGDMTTPPIPSKQARAWVETLFG
jgi:Zn-finger nucleic acid-binding protein